MARIAVVEDDDEYGELMVKMLKHSGYQVVLHPTPGRLFDSLLKGLPDVLILDMQLPGMHGREVLRVLRANEQTKHLVVVAVSAHDRTSADAVHAFESGADEYLAKPVDFELLTVRLEALLRRRAQPPQAAGETLRLGPLTVRMEERSVTLDGAPVDLTNLEFKLLVYFLRQPNRVLTRSLILEMVWNTPGELNTRTVDKHVESLRRKLGAIGARLETVIRIGYMLRAS